MGRGGIAALCVLLWIMTGLAVRADPAEYDDVFLFHSEDRGINTFSLPAAAGGGWTLSKPSTSFGYTASAYADHKYWMRLLLVRADDALWTGGALYGPASAYWGHRLTQGDKQVWAYCIEPNVGTTTTDYEESKAYAVRFMEKLKAYEEGELWRQMVRAMHLGDYLIARDDHFSDADINAAANIVIWELLMGYVSFDGSYTYQEASASYIYPNEAGEALYRLFDTGAYRDFQTIHDTLFLLLKTYETLPGWMGSTEEEALRQPISLRYQEDGTYRSEWLTDEESQLEPALGLGEGSFGFEGLIEAEGTVPGTGIRYEREGNRIRFSTAEPEGNMVSGFLRKRGSGDGATPSAYVSGVVYPAGNRTDGQILASSAQADGIGGYLAFKIEQIPLKIQLQKESKNQEGLFKDHPMYSLEGARYGLYRDAECKDLLEVLTTDEKGTAQSEKQYLPDQKLYLKEIQPPEGFLLDSRIYEISAAAEAFRVYDEPLCCRIPEEIYKVDEATGEMIRDEARFRLDYYRQETPSGTPAWSGVFVTNGEGLLSFQKKFLVEGDGEGIPVDEAGYFLFPRGCIRLSEVTAPTDYEPSLKTLTGYMDEALRWDPADIAGMIPLRDGSYGYPNAPKTGSITICKHRSGDPQTPVPGALLELQRLEAGEWKKVGEARTDETGKAVFTDLPLGEYRVIETLAPEGYMLLGEEVRITIPQEGEREILWLVEEEAAFILPHTGGPGWVWVLSLGITMQAGGTVWAYERKKERRRNDEKKRNE